MGIKMPKSWMRFTGIIAGGLIYGAYVKGLIDETTFKMLEGFALSVTGVGIVKRSNKKSG